MLNFAFENQRTWNGVFSLILKAAFGFAFQDHVWGQIRAQIRSQIQGHIPSKKSEMPFMVPDLPKSTLLPPRFFCNKKELNANRSIANGCVIHNVLSN